MVIACELTQILLKLSEKLLVPLSLVQRHKGVDVGKFTPCNWLKSKKEENICTYTYCNSSNNVNLDEEEEENDESNI